MKPITIQLPFVLQKIFVNDNILSHALPLIERQGYDRIFVIVDKGVLGYHAAFIKHITSLSCFTDLAVIEASPQYKEYQGATKLIDRLVQQGASRKSCIVAIGGGGIGDIVGFVASIYVRGIDFIQFPTTLMAMSDAIIGKVAANYGGHKNIVGSFYSPRFVFCDTSLIGTLSERDVTLALVEVWKHIILTNRSSSRKDLLGYLSHPNTPDLQRLIRLSLCTKKHFVEKDPTDRNGAHKALSLGHTFANYFERGSQMSHGEAVFYGILLATLLSRELKAISDTRYHSIHEVACTLEKQIQRLEYMQRTLDPEDMIRKISFDKINSHGSYTFVIPTTKGYRVQSNIARHSIWKAIESFKSLSLSGL